MGRDFGDGLTFTINGSDDSPDYAYIQMLTRIVTNYTADNLTFRPMIRLATDSDDTWKPYAKTNYELTQDDISNTSRLSEITEKSCLVGQSSNTSDNPYFKVASMNMTTTANQDYVATFMVSDSIFHELF